MNLIKVESKKGKVVGVLVSILVLFKICMVVSDQLKTENGGEALLEKPIMKSAQRLDKKKIKPYLLKPHHRDKFYNELREYRSTGNQTWPDDMPTINVATLVLSAPKNIENRFKLRSLTIGNDKKVEAIVKCGRKNDESSGRNYSVSRALECRKKRLLKQSVVFLLGKVDDNGVQYLLEEENKMFGDILQISVKDSYANLPFKSVAGLEYIIETRKDADLILKINDDLIIYEEALKESLMSVYPFSNGTIYCYQLRNISPWKRKFGLFGLSGQKKLVVDHEIWPADKYPDYCLGWIYALSLSTAKQIIDVVDRTPRYKIDDLYMTGLLRVKAKVKMEMLSTSSFLNSWIWRNIISRCHFMALVYYTFLYDVAAEEWASSVHEGFLYDGLLLIIIQILVEQVTCYVLAAGLLHNQLKNRKLFKILFFIYFSCL